MQQPDILDRLRKWAASGLADEVCQGDLTDDLKDAVAEIEFLRSIAGAVTRGESHADIKARLAKGGDAR